MAFAIIDLSAEPMPPAEADAKMAELTAAYQREQTGVMPEMRNGMTPQQSKARLDHLQNDRAWVDRFLKNDVDAKREFLQLTESAYGGGPAYPAGTVDGVTGEALVDGLRDGGLPPNAERYIRDLDAGMRTDRPTAGDGHACGQMLDHLRNDLGWGNKISSGDAKANAVMRALVRIKSYADYESGDMSLSPSIPELLTFAGGLR